MVLVFGGVLTGPQASTLAAGQPTPWIGLTEHINLYSFMLWVVVLAIALLRVQSGGLRLEERENNVHPEAAANHV